LNATDYAEIPAERRRRWAAMLEAEAFTALMGFRVEEVRLDYARLRMPFRPELQQGGGVVHGGALASLVDTAVVAAILSALDERPKRLATVDLHVHFLDAVVEEDVIAEARVRRRGRSIVFVEVEARAADGREVAHGELAWRISG
jgi:uncharacterized protein (TIGR00369 family)